MRPPEKHLRSRVACQWPGPLFPYWSLLSRDTGAGAPEVAAEAVVTWRGAGR